MYKSYRIGKFFFDFINLEKPSHLILLLSEFIYVLLSVKVVSEDQYLDVKY